MLVIRFKVRCQPDKTAQVAQAMGRVVVASRPLPGVVSFDVGSDITDENTLIATEVFDDESARERQEALPEVATVMSLLPTALAGPPEVTILQATTDSTAQLAT
jgi:quinol monooxygenase YgiN